jgi:hypothetical protein
VIFNNPSIAGGHLDISGVVQYGGAANVVVNGGLLNSTNGLYIISATDYTASSGVYNNLCSLTITNNASVTAGPDANGRAISFGAGNCRPVTGNFLMVGMAGVQDTTVVTALGALDLFYSSAGGTVGNCAVNLNAGTLVVNNIQHGQRQSKLHLQF